MISPVTAKSGPFVDELSQLDSLSSASNGAVLRPISRLADDFASCLEGGHVLPVGSVVTENSSVLRHP